MRRTAIIALTASLLVSALSSGIAAEDSSPERSLEAAGEPWPSTRLKGAEAITAGADRFVVVGRGGKRKSFAKAWVSDDGLTWTRAPHSPVLEGAGMAEVATTGDGFVALGTDEKQRIAAWHSPDGLEWERGTVQGPRKKGLDAWVRDVVDGPAGLMAFGVFIGQDYGGHRLWRSEDGQTWEPIPGPDVENAIFESLVAVPGGYLLISPFAFDGEPSYWRTTDGETWTAIEGAPWMRDAAAADDGTIVGLGLADIQTTSDLMTWEKTWESSNPNSGDDEEEMLWLEWDGTQFAAHAVLYEDCDSKRGKCQVQPLIFSTDGYTWVESAGPDGVPGTDDAWMVDIASVGDSTVVLGGIDETMHAWLMGSPG